MAPIPISRAEYAAKFGGIPAVSSGPIPISRAEYAAKFGAPEEQGPSTSDKVLSWIGNAANSAILNKGAYLSALTETVVEKGLGLVGATENRPLGEIWSDNLEGGKQASRDMISNLGTTGNITSSLAGSLISPINKIGAVKSIYAAPGLAGVAKRAALGAAQGAVTGAGDGQALSNAEMGGGLSVLFDAGGKTASLAGEAFKGMFNKASGLTARDYKAAAMAEGLATAGEGKKALTGALEDTYKTSSPIEYLRNLFVMAKPTEEYLVETAKRSKALRGPVDDKIKAMIAEVSDATGPGQLPDLELINHAASGLNESGKKKFFSKVEELWTDFYAKKSGTLNTLQKEKQGVKFGQDLELNDATQVWRRALRSKLEKAADSFGTESGKWAPGTLKELNKLSGARQGLESGLLKDLPGAQANDAFSAARQSLFTTGSSGAVGADILGGELAGLLALGSYFDPVGRPLGKVMGDLGSVGSKVIFDPKTRTGLNLVFDNLKNQYKNESENKKKINSMSPMSPLKPQSPINPEKVAKIEAKIDSNPFDSAVYAIESSRNPMAKNPITSASGAFQLVKKTAKALGVNDVFDIEQNYNGFKRLKAENVARFGNDPVTLYMAHYLGAPTLAKYLKGQELTKEQQDQVKYLEKTVLPLFRREYEKASLAIKA
ncbi:LT_GEWL domain containing protein [uncultured Caudovirales phage]|uniref:LT_GEWL domain containing protein n=1 Tax=uncultured Caudovirales phage TaxID=2100421 RepID=A0A6J5RX41_9CAUD|nr:LT_GEWL domain containing protein [uncultured Caudovirales phage]